MLLDPETFGKRLRGFHRSAWRWECQPVYNFPAEIARVARFVAGEAKPEGYNSEWHDHVRSVVAEGKTIGRVRALDEPLTDYERYALAWTIPDNIGAGEDVRILDLTDDDFGLPRTDFWVFDDAEVVVLNFADDGTLISIDQLDDVNIPQQYLEWKATASAHAVSYRDYVAGA